MTDETQEPKIEVRSVPAVCLDLLREFEKGPSGSFAATTYMDRGVPCIGWGHRIFSAADPLLHKVITASDADNIALDDLKSFATDLCRELGSRIVRSLTDDQYAALIDFVYNLGFGKFLGSTLHGYVMQERFSEAADEFPKWVYVGKVVSPWLVKRRQRERSLWIGSPSDAKVSVA